MLFKKKEAVSLHDHLSSSRRTHKARVGALLPSHLGDEITPLGLGRSHTQWTATLPRRPHQTDRRTTLHRKPNDVPMDATHRGSIHDVVLVPCVTAWRRNHVKSQWCTCAIHGASAVASTDDNLHNCFGLVHRFRNCGMLLAVIVKSLQEQTMIVICMRGRGGNIQWILDGNLVDPVPWRSLSLTNWLTPTSRTELQEP